MNNQSPTGRHAHVARTTKTIRDWQERLAAAASPIDSIGEPTHEMEASKPH